MSPQENEVKISVKRVQQAAAIGYPINGLVFSTREDELIPGSEKGAILNRIRPVSSRDRGRGRGPGAWRCQGGWWGWRGSHSKTLQANTDQQSKRALQFHDAPGNSEFLDSNKTRARETVKPIVRHDKIVKTGPTRKVGTVTLREDQNMQSS